MKKARVAIIGAGAIGGTVAAILARLGHDVILCVRQPLERLRVEIDGSTEEVRVEIATDPTRVVAVDWVLVATKVQDTPGTGPWLTALVGPDTVVAVLQNGIDHVERLVPMLRQGRVLPTVVYTSAELIAPGHVRHHFGQRIVVPTGSDGAAFAKLFDGGSLAVEQIDDFLTVAWRKLFGNIAVSPITTLTTRRVGIMRDPDIRSFATGLLTEAVVVGRAAGAGLQVSEIEESLDFFATFNPSGGTSMLYDRLAGKQMEHEHLTGALVRTAAQLGIDVPLNRAVLALLRGLDESRLSPQIEGAATSEA